MSQYLRRLCVYFFSVAIGYVIGRSIREIWTNHRSWVNHTGHLSYDDLDRLRRGDL